MLLSLRKNGLTSLFKEVTEFSRSVGGRPRSQLLQEKCREIPGKDAGETLCESGKCIDPLKKIRVVKTVLLANGHFAGVTPAIFVIFVDFRGLRNKNPCFCGQNAISEISPIFVKTTCFRQGTKRPFSKTTVSTTLRREGRFLEEREGS